MITPSEVMLIPLSVFFGLMGYKIISVLKYNREVHRKIKEE